MKKITIQQGFTLVELLLYVSIAAVLLLSVSIFISILLQARIKNQTVIEVEAQGMQAMQIITQTIRNAENINSPATSTSDSSLSLAFSSSTINPTIFALLANALYITEGNGSPTALTNSHVNISGLSFYNLSRQNTPGVIRIQFTISYINPSGRNEYDYGKIFYATASLR